ncbi:hypothetical protein [Azohydromonas sediminis]|uniref:hypothetical protein n=1 Tax=Azohydromonas sediminis TaxID=2259674 RepID=UPI000E65783D|nr:hypothetical protein [Azohydromonas sediminis]
MSKTTFVVFHINLPGSRIDVVPHARGTRPDYVAMAALAFQSAALFHPGCRRLILTDETTAFPGLPDEVELVRRPIDAAKVMYERMRSQLALIRERGRDTNLLFIDADMLINGPVDSLFARDLDLGLTYREHESMPINGGLIAVPRHGHAVAAAFLSRVVDVMQTRYADSLGWYCDQRALIDTIGRERFARRPLDLIDVDGARVALFPCDTYNYTPGNHWRNILARSPRRRIIHFKGQRKRLMRPYWELHLEPLTGVRSSSTRLLRVLARSTAEFLVSNKRAD